MYFKDDTGTLQPVYLTEDGNYAIASTGNEEPEVQEPQQEAMEEDKQDEDTNYIPQMDYSRQIEKKVIDRFLIVFIIKKRFSVII